jgi:hypothetical protein
MNYITLVTEDGKYLILSEDMLVQASSNSLLSKENETFFKVNNHVLIDDSLSSWLETKTSVIKLKKIPRKLNILSETDSKQLMPWYTIVSDFEGNVPFVIKDPIPRYTEKNEADLRLSEKQHKYFFHPSPVIDFLIIFFSITGVVYVLNR